jgi:DNA-binding CsgD family transcriptional regulator
MTDDTTPDLGWSFLTDKQRAVLDLLVEHKTSKEISRILGISPHTVDQRIDTARTRLGFASRGELASAYRRQRDATGPIPERLTHEDSHMPIRPFPVENWRRELAGQLAGHRGGSFLLGRDDPDLVADYRVVPELFDGRWGTLARLAAIFLIALLILMAVLAGFSTYIAVSQSMMH